MATMVNGQFFSYPGATQTFEYVPGGGIRLLGVTSADSGVYSVIVNAITGGAVVKNVQSAQVEVTGKAGLIRQELSKNKPLVIPLSSSFFVMSLFSSA